MIDQGDTVDIATHRRRKERSELIYRVHKFICNLSLIFGPKISSQKWDFLWCNFSGPPSTPTEKKVASVPPEIKFRFASLAKKDPLSAKKKGSLFWIPSDTFLAPRSFSKKRRLIWIPRERKENAVSPLHFYGSFWFFPHWPSCPRKKRTHFFVRTTFFRPFSFWPRNTLMHGPTFFS